MWWSLKFCRRIVYRSLVQLKGFAPIGVGNPTLCVIKRHWIVAELRPLYTPNRKIAVEASHVRFVPKHTEDRPFTPDR